MKHYKKNIECIDYFREKYWFLSNFYPTKLHLHGITYHNAEAAFQAQKCIDRAEQLKFSRLSADESKRLGRKIPLREDWEDVRTGIMKQVVEAKFLQNPLLARALMETGNVELKEGNTWQDLFWGISLKTREGENHLGKILMEQRTKFQMNGIIEDKGFINDLSDFCAGIYLTDEDITQNECECIVNSTDETLQSNEGAAGAIFLAAGLELSRECAALGGCAVGDAKLTNGHHLKARSIIHTVGPRYPSSNCRETLYRCYYNCLSLAKENGIHSIAIPSISTGKFSYPVNEACEIAVNAVKEWLDENAEYSMRVIFCSADRNVFDTMLYYLHDVTSFISDTPALG